VLIASKAEYDRLLGEWWTNGRAFSHSNANGRAYTVNEVMVAFLIYAGTQCRNPGNGTGEVESIKAALRPLR